MEKIITLLLSVIMLVTGCTENTSSSQPAASQTTPAQSADGADTQTPAAESTNGLNNVNRALSNPNATDEAKTLYKYINEIYGTAVLSGQQESTWMSSPEYEMEYISEKSGGKLPAIRGLDFINNDFDGVVERSIEWWDKGGIVTICWHWGAPPDGVGYESSKGTIDMDEALTEGSDLYNAMIEKMDVAAEALLKLQEAGVPVLWRPFHEFDGQWFWWGKGGNEQFIKLWKLMYDRYTNHFGLNNLIWVLGYSHKCSKDWYPGEEYVDISGVDNYSTGTENRRYNRVLSYVEPTMPLVFHECGVMPDPDELIEDGTHWAWFMTWHTNYITDENTPEQVNKIYNHDYVITLDELPDFKTAS